MQHLVTMIGTLVDTDVDTGLYCEAIDSPSLTTTRVDITEADTIGLLIPTSTGYGLSLPGTALAVGDTIMVVGSESRIPVYQVGAFCTVDVDGVAHLANAEAIIAIP